MRHVFFPRWLDQNSPRSHPHISRCLPVSTTLFLTEKKISQQRCNQRKSSDICIIYIYIYIIYIICALIRVANEALRGDHETHCCTCVGLDRGPRCVLRRGGSTHQYVCRVADESQREATASPPDRDLDDARWRRRWRWRRRRRRRRPETLDSLFFGQSLDVQCREDSDSFSSVCYLVEPPPTVLYIYTAPRGGRGPSAGDVIAKMKMKRRVDWFIARQADQSDAAPRARWSCSCDRASGRRERSREERGAHWWWGAAHLLRVITGIVFAHVGLPGNIRII